MLLIMPNAAGFERSKDGTEKIVRLKMLKNSPRSMKFTFSVIAVRLLSVKLSSFRACVRTPGSAMGAEPKLKFAGLANAAGFRNLFTLGSKCPLKPFSCWPGTRLARMAPYHSSFP